MPHPTLDNFTYDVFLSHSANDKVAVRALAVRLREDDPVKGFVAQFLSLARCGRIQKIGKAYV